MSLAGAISEEGYIAMGIYISILGTLALLGNVMVVFLILKKKNAVKKFYNLLLLNMAVADLMLTVTVYPLLAVSSFNQEWSFSTLVCKASGFLAFFLTNVTLNTQTCIAVFRYILVCRASSHHLLRLGTAKPVIAICWIYALFWTSLPLFGWNDYTVEPFKTSCSIKWQDRTLEGGSYIVVTLILCYVFPLITGVACYSIVLKNSFRLSFGTHRMERGSVERLEELLWQYKLETERGVTKMCVAMMAAFLLCWSPYIIVSTLSMSGIHIGDKASAMPTMFARLSCAANPVIYVFMSSKFRQGLRAVLPCARGKQKSSRARQSSVVHVELPVRDSGTGLLFSYSKRLTLPISFMAGDPERSTSQAPLQPKHRTNSLAGQTVSGSIFETQPSPVF